jgi:hypothetical protein
VTDAYTSTIGATAGNIIATIITSHVMRKSPALMIAMPPMPIELACRMVINHAAPAHRSSAATIVALTGLGRGDTRAAGVPTTA